MFIHCKKNVIFFKKISFLFIFLQCFEIFHAKEALIILFLCTSPVAIENITAQVQDGNISTAHWAQFTFWQPRKSAFYKAAARYNYFFSTKKSDDLTVFLSNHRTFIAKQVYRA
jgi:hypothetical protein